jgi:hypothetical protein
MLTRVMAVEHQRVVTSGKTGPSIVVSEKPDGQLVELVAKFSAGCQEGNLSLAREVVAAQLAGDLGLPVPEPFLVRIPAGWSAQVRDQAQKAKIEASSDLAFGSKLMTGGYAIWNEEISLNGTTLPTAASIFVFDAIIQNDDRRNENPNCLVKGDEIRIFDHELAFSHGILLGWKPPWETGAMGHLTVPGRHIFRQKLLKRAIDYVPIKAAWAGLQDERLRDYEAEIPVEWANARGAAKRALQLIRDARDHIDGCLAEVQRVLT